MRCIFVGFFYDFVFTQITAMKMLQQPKSMLNFPLNMYSKFAY